MSQKTELLTPVGRLVQGSLYDPQTTDAENKPLTVRTGQNAGQPRVDFYFAIAIPKGSEFEWSQTPWGAKIQAAGVAAFPNGQTKSPGFAWKITDGDSQIPNTVGRKPADREGYPGHWVLNFSSGFAPGIYTSDGTAQILEDHAVNLGDYIQVYGSVSGNDSQQKPGVFLNHSMVALAGYGKRIIIGADPKTVGFGNSPLPAGASATPLAQGFNPASMATAPPAAAVANAPAPVTPYTPILTPPPPAATIAPPPAAPVKMMTALAAGVTYEAMIAAGWNDAQLIQHGYMVA